MHKNENQFYRVTLLSIPNIWLNFYVYGFSEHPQVKLKLKPQKQFAEYNFTNRMAVCIELKTKKRLIIIDTDDPSERHFNYSGFDFIFLSQKLLEKKSLYPENVVALNPHFPFRHNVLNYLIFKNLIWFKFPKHSLIYFRQNLRLKEFRRVLRINNELPENTIFYYRSLWKKEFQTNLLGALFLDFFKKKGYNVIGGLFRKGSFRTNNEVIDKYVVDKRLKNREYLTYLSKSKFVLNTPACKGALSWRFAEYLFANKKIISTPIEVEMPTIFNYYLIKDNSNLGFLKGLEQLDTFDKSFDNIALVNDVLFPKNQIDFILKFTN